MDPETPRSLGDIEESEPERDTRGRSVPVKKSLEQFLLEFEARLRDHPGESATSAPAALEGRAEGVWRTPVEGGERRGRRLPRPGTGRPGQAPPTFPDVPATVADTKPDLAAPAPPPIEVESEPVAMPAETAPVEVEPVPAEVEVVPVAPVPAGTSPAKKRNRRHRRHRHR